MSKKIQSYDQTTGVTETVTMNDDGMIIEREQDVSGLVSENRAIEAASRRGTLIGNTQKHVRKIASIPSALYFRWCREFGEPRQNPAKWSELLNDPDNRYLRTGGGAV